MDALPTLRSRSIWADLDALVLEEVDALGAGRAWSAEPAAAPTGFASEEAFLAGASAFLRGHDDPERLIERLCIDLGLFRPSGEGLPAAGEEPAAAAAGEEQPWPPGPDRPEADPAGGAEPAA